jgi:hypothetical protein
MTDSIARPLFDAFNRHDAEGCADLFAEDGIQEDRGIEEVFDGRDAISAFVAGTSPNLQITMLSERVDEDGYVAEWEYTGVNTTTSVGGFTPTDKPFRVKGVSVGVLNSEGEIMADREYCDLVTIL